MSHKIDREKHKTFAADRADGRYVNTRGFVHNLLRDLYNKKPKLAFDPQFSREEFLEWQAKIRTKTQEIMNPPDVPPQPRPKLLNRAERDGYVLEKWEIYPQPQYVLSILVLVPEGVSATNPAPAVLCFPGSKGTKEILAGEGKPEDNKHYAKNRMAMFYAQSGIVSVAVDNPGFGETADTGYAAGARELLSLYLLKMGWHYWGLATFNATRILNWMKTLDVIRPDRIALSGHSAGVGAMTSLAILNPDIRALVYNDSLCDGLRRAIVTTKPDEDGNRPLPSNMLRNLIPDELKWYGNVDLRAALAPRYVIYTEGGNQEDLDLVKRAYQIMDAEDKLKIYHHDQFRNPGQRHYDYVFIPEGLSPKEYLEYINCDSENHYFHADVAVPWIKKVLTHR